MSTGIPTRVIAVCCGISGFVVAIVSGLAADNPASDILFRAILALLICQTTGWGAGLFAEAVLHGKGAQAVNKSFTMGRSESASERPVPSI